ncbi:MAG: 16S rRNA (adenine(1518)-N(6)/adenine(1519)-N(6))-dimethyltransferase RsmA [Acidimicrobiia bacterium]|nr:16S rRNA (adenine(1518)-N(6)/adenine(1519)-N(6))-dimethyltransferase RsmA [Acidimicrobiia bacterium]
MPEPLTPRSVRALLEAHGLRPSRALGQNFLTDPNTAERIVRLSGVVAGDRVLEVGPGVGSLTVALGAAGVEVTAVEIDSRLVAVLEDVLAGTGSVVVEGDALRIDWSALLDMDRPWTMVSNLPYNVATPVLIRALETAPMIGRFLVMVQREVGERIAAGAGEEAYGAVSVKVAYHCTAEVVGTVPSTVFAPRPKVESALVRLERRAAPPVEVDDPDWMFRLVRAGFATRRKMLRRALATVLGARAEDVLRAAGIDPEARAETLGLPEWAAIAAVEREAGQS